jgi:murein DD-endopeptidase MepM/ murein hydrolase activator NlpD
LGKNTGRSAVFGQRREPHTIIIARGDHIRHFTVRPWVAALAGTALAAISISYLIATTYLVVRDDLIGAATARQARIQHAYEDRISALRAEVDRITSRQTLDQRLMESRVGELLKRQTQLTERHGRLGPALEIVSAGGEHLPEAAPVPVEKPDIRAAITGTHAVPPALHAEAAREPFSFWPARRRPPGPGAQADELFASISQSLRLIETEQLMRADVLAETAYQTADSISAALEDAGLPVESDDEHDGIGGPLVELDGPAMFEVKVRELDAALDLLDRMKSEARRLPIASPAPGRSVSSAFGVRKDPLLGRPAMHSGMDFRAPSGSPARVTAAGKVVKAGWQGGYGRMVEVEHAGGFTTRYGHLRKIEVGVGQQLVTGDVVGAIGSSGRSTGPHLHYEVRRHGEALDPMRFIRAGRKVGGYL